MRILAVDTSSDKGSVAVVEGGETLAELRLVAPTRHSRRILSSVDFLLGALETSLQSIDGYAVAIGPWSFTGLRIGISTLQGLALGLPRPCLGVSSLDVLAAQAAGRGCALAAMLDARRDEVYGACYDTSGGLLAGPFAEPPALFASRLPPGAAYLGSGAVRYRALIEERGGEVPPDGSELHLPRACFHVRLAGAFGRAELVEPIYVRPPDAKEPPR